MNMAIKFIFLIIFLFQSCLVPFAFAEDKKDQIDEEELPAIDPFAGSTGSTSLNDSGSSLGSASNIMSNMKLTGTIFGENKRIAVLSMPDGRVLKFEENSYITNEIFLMDVLTDLITIKIGDKDEYEVYMNSQIKPREGN